MKTEQKKWNYFLDSYMYTNMFGRHSKPGIKLLYFPLSLSY